ncbi:MAG: hypothetical protein A2157_02715 [Deltaproteobacteria bacterium RBG_16_47_11]|nr:MAG: hypothetical protein A2157_02715 [Deltaproteobacteria bacterium RBG_16_47_11]
MLLNFVNYQCPHNLFWKGLNLPRGRSLYGQESCLNPSCKQSQFPFQYLHTGGECMVYGIFATPQWERSNWGTRTISVQHKFLPSAKSSGQSWLSKNRESLRGECVREGRYSYEGETAS